MLSQYNTTMPLEECISDEVPMISSIMDSTSLNDEYQLKANLFEQLYQSNQCQSSRTCRRMIVDEEIINNIMPGNFCELLVYGGGMYTQWNYYMTLDGTHMYAFISISGIQLETKTYTYQIIQEIPYSF